MKKDISHISYTKTVQDLIHYHENDSLNLSPGFQRQSVWNIKDREKLIDSIVRNYPIPAIFLYKRVENGKTIYDVIDGKQRIESILMFMGLIRGSKFSAKIQLPEREEYESVDWNYFKRHNIQHLVTGYNIYTIEVDGGFNNIIDLFVRINSTGKPLTSAEKQHAKFYNSNFLKTSAAIAKRYEKYFIANKIISNVQISRMKHVELVCELMISIFNDEVSNKKAALDKVMNKNYLTVAQINKAKEKTQKALNRILFMFPKIKETRFKQLSDFFILTFLIAKYENEGMVLTDKKKNMIAWNLLKSFSVGVDTIRDKQKKFEGISETEQMYRNYLLTVSQNTDDKQQRDARLKIIDGLLRTLFERKDGQRLFSPEQRRLIWHTSDKQICSVCKAPLDWNNFTVDHIVPHSKGGRSEIKNAALMCRKHNSSKGNRR